MAMLRKLASDIRWKKEDKLMPGVKFGIKYKSVTRHRNEVHERHPLADITINPFNLGPGVGDEMTEQEQNEETRRRKKRQRLEIPGLLHPDDLTPSRQRSNSNASNATSKKRGMQQDKQQHSDELGEPTQHYLVSLIRNCHRQLYGDPSKCSGQVEGEGDSTSQLPSSTFSSPQDVIWGGVRSTIELVAVSHLESNMVFQPHLGWSQHYSSTHMSGQQAARVFNVLPRPSANDFHLPRPPVTASHDLLNLYSSS
ncbi:uncharacterized protein LOC135108153 [Scylla paramamosain]|uniref:uncharacterized protein LOC135108153 n=1 Tax=Scylla paramamosain TaxID=85552 RepID=UPI003082D0DD